MKRRYCLTFLVLSLYLGIHNGYLTLWDTQQSRPVEIFPYRAAVYPNIDQEALEQGIPVQSRDQLKSLLEDFLS